MGVRGLETFIRENPQENIAEFIDIRDEITKWQAKNDRRNPKILVHANQFIKILAKIDRNTLIYGGQYDNYNKKISKFFEKLKDFGAELVFFFRPFLNHIDKKTISEAYDHAVRDRKELHEFKVQQEKCGNLFPWHLDKRFLYNLMQICSKYGEMHTALEGTTFNIVQYAREHCDEVLAMIAYDTDFLLFDGEYQYWNLADLEMANCTCQRYRTDTLRARFQLDTARQFQMVSALSRLEKDVVNNFVRGIETDERNGAKIFKLAKYVRRLDDLDSLEPIANDIFGPAYTSEQLKQIQDEMVRYEMTKPDQLDGFNQNFRDLIEFFLANNLCFAYGLALETLSTNQALAYIDLRRDGSQEFIKLMVENLMKQCGILFKDFDERPSSRAIKINDETMQQPIVYPPVFTPECPRLDQLIIQENNKSFDSSRWSLFGWSLGLDPVKSNKFIVTVRSQLESNQFMRVVTYTLKYLLSNHVISSQEADRIFLAEWNSPNGKYRNDNESPAASSNQNAESLNFACVPFQKRNDHMKNGLEKNATSSLLTPAPLHPIARGIVDAIFMQPADQKNTIIPTVPMQNDYNTRRWYNRGNWRDPSIYNVPHSSSAAPWNGLAMNGFKRNNGYYNNGNRWQNAKRSNEIEIAWIQTAHKYTIAFESICHCLELCGLRNETDLIQFDALDFHANSRENKKNYIDDQLRKTAKERLYY